ncbi:MAG: 23S rRNA (adenine(2503)-C(2))-methyltransferase RlmN [Acidobacteria bacterium]|nr:23S rRNA (adenine(2503)-C(2))-methyltransferase RlmN [Acidobacteriota bacterium]
MVAEPELQVPQMIHFAAMALVNLMGRSLEEIEEAISGLNEPKYRARQIYAGIYRRLLHSWDHFTDLGKQLREKLKEQFTIEHPPIRQVFVSRDGTRRYLFEVPPGQKIESVFIPEDRRDTVCISTQAGCAVGCLFCVTGKLGLRRNLTSGEIVGQVLALQSDRGTAAKRLNIVIMGMGEPLNNYDNVMKAIRLMTHKDGMSISPRRITLSTSGVAPGIRRLAKEEVIPNLAISLNATTDSVRDMLIPINRKWNIAALLETCRGFPLEQRRRITFEYVLIEGVNDSPEDARRLADLLQGLKKKINLIPLNADPWIPLKTPSWDRILDFEKILVDRCITVNIRRSRGDDVSAACGMLAGREEPAADAAIPPGPAR